MHNEQVMRKVPYVCMEAFEIIIFSSNLPYVWYFSNISPIYEVYGCYTNIWCDTVENRLFLTD